MKYFWLVFLRKGERLLYKILTFYVLPKKSCSQFKKIVFKVPQVGRYLLAKYKINSNLTNTCIGSKWSDLGVCFSHLISRKKEEEKTVQCANDGLCKCIGSWTWLQLCGVEWERKVCRSVVSCYHNIRAGRAFLQALRVMRTHVLSFPLRVTRSRVLF